MQRSPHDVSDSQLHPGGSIPGVEGACAFELRAGRVSSIPVLISVPHAGRCYPPSLLGRMRHPEQSALRLEDRLVDMLGEAVSRETGAALLVAHAPRALIDLNRATDDVDWSMIDGDQGDDEAGQGGWRPRPSARARNGLGLIPRRLPGLGEIWKARHAMAELAARIAGIHDPYHDSLSRMLADMRERWGAVLLIDLHSMPPLPPRGGQRPPELVLGDRFGATCHGGLVASAFACFAQAGRVAAHNRPYAGGYVLERHAAPRRGIHAVQLEIDRSCYLDSRLVEPGEGFAPMVELLSGLVRRLAGEVAMLGGLAGRNGWRTGRDWAEAAE